MKKRYIEISELPNFEVTTNNGQKFVLLPFEHLSDIPVVNIEEIIKDKLKYYLDTNEENGVVYIPKFVIEKIVNSI